MVVTQKDFSKLADLYKTLIKQFLALHNIKEVVCTDTKEHFFDRIVAKENGSIEVFNYGFTKTAWNELYFDFTCDYAKCLSNMEHDLFLQTRNGKHDMYTFYFTEQYQKPTLIPRQEIDELEKQYQNRRNE